MNHKKLLILSLIFAVVGVGAYLYSYQQGRTSNNNPLQPATAVVPESSTSPGGIPGGAYGGTTATKNKQISYKIPEVGLAISLPASLNDLTYHVSSAANGNSTISFSTKSLTSAIPACSAQRPGGAFSSIVRGSGQYLPPTNPADGGLLYQAPSYYFAYLLPNGPCAKNLSSSQQRLLDSQAQDFYNVVFSSKPISD